MPEGNRNYTVGHSEEEKPVICTKTAEISQRLFYRPTAQRLGLRTWLLMNKSMACGAGKLEQQDNKGDISHCQRCSSPRPVQKWLTGLAVTCRGQAVRKGCSIWPCKLKGNKTHPPRAPSEAPRGPVSVHNCEKWVGVGLFQKTNQPGQPENEDTSSTATDSSSFCLQRSLDNIFSI